MKTFLYLCTDKEGLTRHLQGTNKEDGSTLVQYMSSTCPVLVQYLSSHSLDKY